MGDMGESFGMGDEGAAAPSSTCVTCAELQAELKKVQRQAKHYRKQREQAREELVEEKAKNAKLDRKIKAFLD